MPQRTVSEEDVPRGWGSGWAAARPMPIRSDYVKTAEPDPGIWAYLAAAKRAGRPSRAKIDLGGAALNVLGALESAKNAKTQEQLAHEKLNYEDAWRRYTHEEEMAKEKAREDNIAADNARGDKQLAISERLARVTEQGPDLRQQAIDINAAKLAESAKNEAERQHLRELGLGLQSQGLTLREENLKRQREADAALAKYREEALAGRPAKSPLVDPYNKALFDDALRRYTADPDKGGEPSAGGARLSENEKDDLARLSGNVRRPAVTTRLGVAAPATPPVKPAGDPISGGNPKPPGTQGRVPKEGDVIRGPKGDRLVMRGGQWQPLAP